MGKLSVISRLKLSVEFEKRSDTIIMGNFVANHVQRLMSLITFIVFVQMQSFGLLDKKLVVMLWSSKGSSWKKGKLSSSLREFQMKDLS